MTATITQNIREYTVIAARNLCLNPGFETNTTGWSGTSATISRQTSEQHSGAASMRVIATATDNRATTAITAGATASADHIASFWIKGEAGKLARIVFFEYTSADALVGNTVGSDVVMTGSWQRISIGRTFGPTGTKWAIAAQNRTAGAHTFYVDDVMCDRSANLSDYFDGDTADTVTYRYDYESGAGSISYKWARSPSTDPLTATFVTRDGFSLRRRIHTTVHDLLDGGNPAVTLTPGGLRAGTLPFLFPTYTEAVRAFTMHGNPSTFTLTGETELGTMTYVPVEETRLIPTDTAEWVLEVPFREVFV